MGILSDIVRKIQLHAVGSYQSELLPMSPARNLITNTNALQGEAVGLYSADKPTESGLVVAPKLSAAGSSFAFNRQATTQVGMRFSLGHDVDANGKTANVVVRGWRPRVVKGSVQWEGEYLVSFLLTGGNTVDTNSLLLPDVVPAEATSFKHVSTIALAGSGDKTIGASVKVTGDVANGKAMVFFDTMGCSLLTVEGSVQGVTAKAIAGEYVEI